MLRRARYWSLWTLLTFAALTGPGTVADDAKSENRLITDVVRMLEGDVGSSVIVDWLNLQTGPVPSLSSDDMVRLKHAGATDEVIQKLLELSISDTPAAAASAGSVAAGRVPSSPPLPGEAAEVTVSLRYRSQSDDGDQFSMRWALYVYLDGELLTWSKSQGSFSKKYVTTIARLEPGRHEIRLLRESHKKEGKKGWRHESLVSPDVIEFELEPGGGWVLSLAYVDPNFQTKNLGPLSWKLSRVDKVIHDVEKQGRRIGDWSQLCDDMLANVPEGKKTPSWVKRELKACVEWSSLWGIDDESPARGDVRAGLEQHEFRPPRATLQVSPYTGG